MSSTAESSEISPEEFRARQRATLVRSGEALISDATLLQGSYPPPDGQTYVARTRHFGVAVDMATLEIIETGDPRLNVERLNIYRPVVNPMHSGQRNVRFWFEFERFGAAPEHEQLGVRPGRTPAYVEISGVSDYVVEAGSNPDSESENFPTIVPAVDADQDELESAPDDPTHTPDFTSNQMMPLIQDLIDRNATQFVPIEGQPPPFEPPVP